MDDSSVRSKMQEVISLVISDIASIRSGRATPAIVEDLEVAVYGGQQKLKVNELATISATDAQSIIIDPWDKSIIGEIKQDSLDGKFYFPCLVNFFQCCVNPDRIKIYL